MLTCTCDLPSLALMIVLWLTTRCYGWMVMTGPEWLPKWVEVPSLAIFGWYAWICRTAVEASYVGRYASCTPWLLPIWLDWKHPTTAICGLAWKQFDLEFRMELQPTSPTVICLWNASDLRAAGCTTLPLTLGNSFSRKHGLKPSANWV